MIEHLLEPHICRRFILEQRYREGHMRVVNALPCRKVLGLHTPDMKELAKELSRNGGSVLLSCGEKHNCGNGAEIISCFENVPPGSLCYEETVIWGFLINLEKCDVERRFAMLSKFVPVMDNWAVCDSFCANAKWMAKVEKGLLWEFLQQWFASQREFEVRFALVSSMCHFLCEGWLEKVFEKVDALELDRIESLYKTIKGKPQVAQEGSVQGKSPYYVRMGVAWLLATALAKFPEHTRAFVRESHLPTDVVRLYVRKARESFRTRTVEAL